MFGLRKIELCKEFAGNYEEKFKHITDDDREIIRKEVASIEEWMYDLQEKQGALAKNQNPVMTADNILKKRNALFSATNPIIIKKAPAPAPAPAPAKEAKAEETPAADTNADADADTTTGEEKKGGEEKGDEGGC